MTPDPILKICGITRIADARHAIAHGARALGFVFWPHSPRFIDPERAADLVAALPSGVDAVGVFVNASVDDIRSIVAATGISIIQLHGDESPEFARPLAEQGVPFLKAIGVKTAADLERAGDYGAAGVLLDAHAPGVYGGTGETFDWSVASAFREAHPSLPVILAGGIVPENAADALRAVRPAALDVASGSESAPGIKDFAKVAALLAAVRAGF